MFQWFRQKLRDLLRHHRQTWGEELGKFPRYALLPAHLMAFCAQLLCEVLLRLVLELGRQLALVEALRYGLSAF